MELSDLYSEKILEIAGNPPKAERLPDADASARKVSRICGSSIEVDVKVRDGRIVGYGHDISACALGQTSAAIVTKAIVGADSAQFRTISARFRAMLKGDGPAEFSSPWEDLKYLEPVRDYPARHTSTLLVFDAVNEALDKIEQAAAAGHKAAINP